MTPPLYRTTIVIWSRFNANKVELSELARAAEDGDAYCSSYRADYVPTPDNDPAWDGTEFFEVAHD